MELGVRSRQLILNRRDIVQYSPDNAPNFYNESSASSMNIALTNVQLNAFVIRGNVIL